MTSILSNSEGIGGISQKTSKFPCTSESLRLHIQRAYFQSMEWDHAAFQSSSYPLEYGYKLEDSLLEPIIVNVKNIRR